MPTIKITNESTGVSDDDLKLWIGAIQQQVQDDVAPFWEEARDINLEFVPRGQPVAQNEWQVVLRDDNDSPPNLGNHKPRYGSSGPVAQVFVRTTIADGEHVSRVMSHEIIEMIIDPDDTRTQQINGVTYLVEGCDPVHLDRYGYQKSGVLVSNFVTPDYYRYTTGSRFDFRKLLTAPCPAVLDYCVACKIDQNGQMELVPA
jgi:hypothetical protein